MRVPMSDHERGWAVRLAGNSGDSFREMGDYQHGVADALSMIAYLEGAVGAGTSEDAKAAVADCRRRIEFLYDQVTKRQRARMDDLTGDGDAA